MGPGLPKGKEEPSEVWRWFQGFLRGRRNLEFLLCTYIVTFSH